MASNECLPASPGRGIARSPGIVLIVLIVLAVFIAALTMAGSTAATAIAMAGVLVGLTARVSRLWTVRAGSIDG